MLPLLTILVIVQCYKDIDGQGLTITVKEPIRKTGPDLALIIIPQSNVDALQYQQLGDELQKTATTFRLWVGYIGGWDDGVPNLLEMDHGFMLMLRRLYELGLAQHAAVIVAGHGYGGGSLSDYVDLHPTMFTALILFSHAPMSSQKLTELTLPTMFMSGDLDGVMTIFSAADIFQRLVTESPTAPDLVYNTPVVTLEGVNHTHYFSGEIPVNLTYSDIEGDITYQEAWGNISYYVVAFLVAQGNMTGQDVNAAKTILQAAYNDNQERMGNIYSVQSMDQNDVGHSPWTEQSQTYLVGLTGSYKNSLKVSSDVISEILLPKKKPTISVNNSVVTVETYAEVTRPRGVDKVNASLTAFQLQAKMKRKSAILSVLPNATFENTNLTCKDLNGLVYKEIQLKSSPVAMKRFSARGRPVILNADIDVKSGPGWVIKQLELVYSADGLHVTSCSLVTDDNFIIKSVAGMHYCKLLAPSRVMEWIYVDSLRGSKATINN